MTDPVESHLGRAYPPAAWRLVCSPFAPGADNMAIDEAILLAVAAGAAPPTLRFYGWAPPCLSLGYAQPAAEVDHEALARHGWHLVRRPTGGRAILHTDELTYSIIAPMDEPRVRGGVVESYQHLSAGLLRGLAQLGLPARADRTYAPPAAANGGESEVAGQALGPVCFEVPSNYEITVGEGPARRKLLGSAQVRKQGVVLQHGTLPLGGDLGRICDALAFAGEAERERVRQRVYQRAATASDVAGREVSWAEATAALTLGMAEALSLSLNPAALTPAEAADAGRLAAEKYGTDSWNLRV
jgi:lipoate-protein ligase A